MHTIPTAIIGASGYSGEELLRLLSRHPEANLTALTSRTWAGQAVGDVFPRHAGLDLVFSVPDVSAIAATAQVAFLALPHGHAAEFAVPLLDMGVKVIDISADFRLDDPAVYEATYGAKHPAPDRLAAAAYGLPEFNRDRIREAQLIACPGCYPTSVLLPVVPLLASGLASNAGITISSCSGVSGAGRKVDLPFLFPECNESVRPYSPTGHRHIPEIEQELTKLTGATVAPITFTPHLVPITRGMVSTIFLKCAAPDVTTDRVMAVLNEAYADEPFVRVLAAGKMADTKNVTLTNIAEIGATVDGRSDTIVVSCAIDNLTKGASGQAVQCMNVMFDLDETVGLE